MLSQRHLLLTSVVLSALTVCTMFAQVEAPDASDDAPAPSEQDTGVYVRDAAVVTERVALAERMERSKEWGKAADLLQEIIEKNGQRIVPANEPGDRLGKRYIGATDLVQRRLSKWPADGLAAYVARYGTVAQSLLDAAPFDPAVLGRVEGEYFVTDAGKLAGLRRIDLALEAGEFGSAAWTADRLVAMHPTLGEDRPAILFRAGLAHHLSGDVGPATNALDELKAKYPTATAVVAGKVVTLADALAQALAEPAPVATEVASDSWPTLGGGPSRSRVPRAAGHPGARMAFVNLSPPNPRNVPPQLRPSLRNRPDTGTTGVMPVVDRGELFFQDGQRIYGVSLDSGNALPGWATTYPGPLEGRYAFEGAAASAPFQTRGQQLNATVTDDRVLAVMGQANRRLMEMGGVAPATKLVCLDRLTGARRWVAGASDLKDEALRTMTLGGSPLVVGDNVYVTGRSAKQANFEDCYVLCFGLSDGKPKWTCYVSGASAFNPEWADGPVASDNEAHVAFAGGRLFVSTNLGAVAALDAYGGGLLWLTTYPRGEDGPGGGAVINPQMQLRVNGRAVGGTGQRAVAPWAYNPPVVRDNRVFAMPADSPDVFVFDAGTGAIRRRVLSRHVERLDTLVGVTPDGQLILAGNIDFAGNPTALLLGIDWQKYDPRTFKPGNPAAEPTITIRKTLPSSGPGRESAQADTLRGRPFLTEGFAYVPTGARLYCINLRTRGLEDRGTYPKHPRAWDVKDPDGEGPGNVLVVGDHVVLAGPRRVDVYTDLAIARAKLNADEAAAPSDPGPRLSYAAVMFVAGEVPTSLAKMDEAVGLMGGPRAMRPGPNRDRLFADALAFGTKLTASRADGPTIARQAADLFDRAAAAAATPEQHVAWRVARAKLFARTREYTQQVRMAQEILSDEAMRAVPSFDERDGPTTAGAVAEREIGALIAAIGPQTYTPYELVAEEKFAAARGANDAPALLAVARTYPNARVATRALVAAADAYEAAGDARLAGHVLRQALRKDVNGPQRDAIVEAIARNYLTLPGGTDLAVARLTKAVRPDDDPAVTRPMKWTDGSPVTGGTFMAVLDDLRQRGRQQATDADARLPDLRLAGAGVEVDPVTKRKRAKRAFLPPAPADAVTGVVALVVPGDDHLSRSDRVVAWTGRSVAIFAPGNPQPVATFDGVNRAPVGAGWVGTDLVVWSTDTIWRLAPDRRQVVWTAPLSAMPTLPPAPVIESDAALADGAEVMHVNRGGLFGMNGRVRPVDVPPGPTGDTGSERVIDLHPTATRVVLLTSSGRLASLDLATGAPAWQVRLGDAGPDRLVATDEFTVARAVSPTSSTLLVVDTFSGQVLGRPRFSADSGTPPLANFALSADGTLVYTLADRLATKDLFEPWEGKPPNERIAEAGPGTAVFSGATRPDQLVVNDGLVAALSGSGMVRVYSLLTQREHLQQLSTGASDWDVSLRLVGSQLYTVSPKAYRSFDLVNPAPPETQIPPLTDVDDRPTTVRGALFGRRHVVLLDAMGQGAPNPGAPMAGEFSPAPSYRLWAYNRERVNGVENGIIDHLEIVNAKSGITAWQAVDGGACYHTLDGKLHFLRGARAEE